MTFDFAASVPRLVWFAMPPSARADVPTPPKYPKGMARWQEKPHSVPFDDLVLSVRTEGVLRRLGVEYLGDLTLLSERDLLRQRNFGRKGLREVKCLLDTVGLSLSSEDAGLFDGKTLGDMVHG